MGGVDIVDQYRFYCKTQLTTFRTWFPISFYVQDTALVNSYNIYRDIDADNGITHKEFRLLVTWD